MMEKDGILKNGVFLEHEFKNVLTKDTELDENNRQKSIKALPICMDEAKYLTDLCNKAYTITVCLYKAL